MSSRTKCGTRMAPLNPRLLNPKLETLKPMTVVYERHPQGVVSNIR